MRQRIEDLGRLAVLIKQLLDHQLFDDNLSPRRPKDYDEWFSQLSDERQDEVISEWVYGIRDLQEKLYDLLSIAEGTDDLNEITREAIDEVQ